MKARQLETEVATLVKLLMPSESAKWRPVIDEIRVAPGYEVALGAALSDDLEAGLDPNAPVRWRHVSADGDPALPGGTQPLSGHVKAPAELARSLAQIGIVDRTEGAALQAQLKPGQRLVSREGDVWRWDGFIAAADAPTAAAKRLAERNRLGQLEEQRRSAACRGRGRRGRARNGNRGRQPRSAAGQAPARPLASASNPGHRHARQVDEGRARDPGA